VKLSTESTKEQNKEERIFLSFGSCLFFKYQTDRKLRESNTKAVPVTKKHYLSNPVNYSIYAQIASF
jgi:hypothetical protein